MARIEVDIYNKTLSKCPHCASMRKVFDRWCLENEECHEVTSVEMSAEYNLDILMELGVQSAPVYVIRRDGHTSVVSGDSQDDLVELLEGRDLTWG